MCCPSGSGLWPGLQGSAFAVPTASLPVPVSVTQLGSTAQARFQLRVRNPDDIMPISVRTRCYHLRLCDFSSPVEVS